MLNYGQAALYRGLIRSVCVTTFVMSLILVAGQFSQLSSSLSGITLRTWIQFIPSTFLVLLEAVLPISLLFASALTYGLWRSQGLLTAYQGSGRSPIQVVFPACALGVLLMLCTAWCAHRLGPQQLESLKSDIQDAWITQIETGGLQLASGGWVTMRESIEDGGAYWFSIPSGDDDVPPVLGTARTLHVEWNVEGPRILLKDIHVWAANAKLFTPHMLVHLDPAEVNKKLSMLGPPNALSSSELDLSDTHHAFIFQRRLSMSAVVIFWAIFGALLGLCTGPFSAVLGSSALVAISYWVLRAGELAARHGDYPVLLAAWGPVVVSAVAVIVCLKRARGRRGLFVMAVG